MKRTIGLAVLMITAFTLGAAGQAPSAPAPAKAPAARPPAAPAAPASAGPAKIGVVAFQMAVTSTNEFQRGFLDLQKKFEPRRNHLHTLSDEIDALTKQLQAPPANMTDADKETKARSLDDKKKQFDREQQDAQSDFSQQIQDLFSGTASKMLDVLTAYAQQHGYTVVLDVATQQPTVMYALDTMNITPDLIAAYNTKSGVPPVPASPAPAAAPKPAAAPAKPGAGAAKPPSQ